MKKERSEYINKISRSTRLYLRLLQVFGVLLFIVQAFLVMTLKGGSILQFIILGAISTLGLFGAALYCSIGRLAFRELQCKQLRGYFRPYILSALLTFCLLLFVLVASLFG